MSLIEDMVGFVKGRVYKIQNPVDGEPWSMEFTGQNGNSILLCDFDQEYLVNFIPGEANDLDVPEMVYIKDMSEINRLAETFKKKVFKVDPFNE